MAKIFTNIPINFDFDKFYSLTGDSFKKNFSAVTLELVDEIKTIAKPKALYKELYIESKGADFIVASDVTFTGKTLRDNLEKVNKFYLYVASCGIELFHWAKTKTDMVEVFVANSIMEYACRYAGSFIENEIDKTFKLSSASSMNPGSTFLWPLAEQKKIFSLVRKEVSNISVSLNEDCLMFPEKSISGIRYDNGVKFYNCQLCKRTNCPTRIKIDL